MKKVSIIIPIYNSEKYVNKCIDSIIKQTMFSDIELILINDGSKDNSFKIIEEYSKEYQNIKVYNQENMGIAKTRNKGIKLANSKYIMFIDNDDWIENDYVEKYYKEIINTKSDVVVGGYKRCTYNKTLFIKKIINKMDIYAQIAPWAKIYNKQFLLDNKIEFFSHPIGEDVFFSIKLYNKSNKIKIINYVGYNWFYNIESVSNSQHKKGDKDLQFLKLIDKVKSETTMNNELEYFIIRLCIWFIYFTIKNTQAKIYQDNFNSIFNYLETNFPDYKKNKYLKFKHNHEFKILFVIKITILLNQIKIGKCAIFFINKYVFKNK